MPDFFTVLGIIIAVFALSVVFVLSLRGTLTVAYDGEFYLSFRILFLNLRFLPIRERKKRYSRYMSRRQAKKIREEMARKEERKRAIKELLFGKKEKKPEEGENKSEDEKKSEEKNVSPKFPIKLVAREIIDILSAFTEIVAIIVKRFAHHLKVKIVRFKVKIATEDPALTAVTYGAATGIINVLLPILEDVDNLGLPKEKNLDVSTDFLSDTPEIDMKVSFSIRTWHIADIFLRTAIGGISKYVDRKGGIDKTLENISRLVGAFTPRKEAPQKAQNTENREKNN